MRKLQNVGMFVLVYTTLFSSLCVASSLRVSWNEVTAADLDGYKVYYGTQSGAYSTIATVRNASSCLISNVQNGSTYYIAVSSFDKSGNESSRSAEVSAYIPVTETDTTPPAGIVDTTPPTGSLLINANASTTTSTTVTLSLYFSDANGTVTAMKFSNDGINYTSETSVAPSIIWTLSDGYGLKTVHVLFKDAAGNWMSTPATASINLVSPSIPTSTIVVPPAVDPSTSTQEGTTPVQDDVNGGQASSTDVANIKPIITSPDNNQEEVPLRPTLKTDSHAQDYSMVQWEISNDAGEALLDLKTDRYRTELVVPDMVLSAGMKHYCRVRYLDGSGNTSDWSDPVAFNTVAYDPQDMNLNGIPDDQELIAGEDIDLDMNGVHDRIQSDMKALLTEIGGEYVSLKISTNCRAITSFKSIDPATIADTEGKPHDHPSDSLISRQKWIIQAILQML